MARARHAMRVHPLRSKGVVVGVPVAAAVAFGAHSVLGVTPLSEQQDVPTTTSAAPAAAPVQSYGLATAPPPTTLDLLSAPGDQTPASSPSAGATASPSASGTAGTARSTTTKIDADRAPTGPTSTVPIAAPAAAAPAPSMMTFTGEQQPQAQPAVQAAPQAQAAPQQQTAAADGGAQQSSGGSLLGVDLGVAKVSVLSFGQ